MLLNKHETHTEQAKPFQKRDESFPKHTTARLALDRILSDAADIWLFLNLIPEQGQEKKVRNHHLQLCLTSTISLSAIHNHAPSMRFLFTLAFLLQSEVLISAMSNFNCSIDTDTQTATWVTVWESHLTIYFSTYPLKLEFLWVLTWPSEFRISQQNCTSFSVPSQAPCILGEICSELVTYGDFQIWTLS